MKKVYFIINPKAKNGYSLKVWEQVKKELGTGEIAFTSLFTEHPGHAAEIAADIKDEAEAIVVIGGDGTIHEVVNGLGDIVEVPIGFIPAGSGNDFRRGFQIPKSPRTALRFLLQQVTLPPTNVDVGDIVQRNERRTRFINNMGAGFDAMITKEANDSRLKAFLNRFSLGNLIYAYFVIRHIFTYKSSTCTVTIDGEIHRFDKVWFVTVANQPYYGGGMKISPNASPTDGFMNITVVHHLSRLKFLLVFITVFWGGHTRFQEVKHFTGKKIIIKGNSPMPVHADGEYIGETPVSIETFQQRVPLLVREIDKRGS